MDEKYAVELLVREVQDYAKGRANDVARGAETPEFAALLLQKYGVGIAKAIAIIFDTPRAADPIMAVLDQETEMIDPHWREHTKQRWNARPADIKSPAA